MMPRTLQSRLTFGKHRGKRLGDVPISYLQWMRVNLRDDDFHEWAILAGQELERRMNSGEMELEMETDDLNEQADQILRRHGFNPHRVYE